MGLDSYLSASRYVSGWDHANDTERKAFDALLRAAGLKREDITDGAPSGTLSLHVGYWRKANAIHGWFVKHVQDGKDECQESSVSRDQLFELLAACDKVLAATGDEQKTLAQELLPPRAGFFFGSTDIDQYYLDDLRDTVKMLKHVLTCARFKGWDFAYQASW